MSTALCPLCGEPNRCALADANRSGAPCWCVGREFSEALLARVPDRNACICDACRRAKSAESAVASESEGEGGAN